MMKNFNLFFCAALLLLCAACDEYNYKPLYEWEPSTETRTVITLSDTNLVLVAKDGYKLISQISTNHRISWTSSDPSILTCEEGYLYAKKSGSVKVTASSNGATYAVKSCSVTVVPLELDISVYNLNLSNQKTKKINTKPTNIRSNLRWKSSNPSCVEVSQYGYVTAKNYGEATITAYLQSDSTVSASCKFNVVYPQSYGYEFVDLGLPSATLWAKMNVDATTETGYGGYYAWGEIYEKSTYDWSNLKYCSIAGKDTTFTKYYTNYSSSRTLLSSDDVATKRWGAGWSIPTPTQFQELIDNCYVSWIYWNGVYGRRFTSKINGNSIFLPAGGYKYLSNNTQSSSSLGRYWSNKYCSNDKCAYSLYLSSSEVYQTGTKDRVYYKAIGMTIRPVLHY